MTNLDAAPSAAAPDAPAPAALAERTRPVGGGWIAAFASAWLGIWMAQLTPVQLVLPAQIDAVLHHENWVDSVVAFGLVSGIAALQGVAALLLAVVPDLTVAMVAAGLLGLGYGSFLSVFVLGAVCAFAGALAVTRVRGVR